MCYFGGQLYSSAVPLELHVPHQSTGTSNLGHAEDLTMKSICIYFVSIGVSCIPLQRHWNYMYHTDQLVPVAKVMLRIEHERTYTCTAIDKRKKIINVPDIC